MPPGGTAQMRPTANYALFEQAKHLHRTVRELLTGQAGRLGQMEFWLWQVFRLAEQRLQQQVGIGERIVRHG